MSTAKTATTTTTTSDAPAVQNIMSDDPFADTGTIDLGTTTALNGVIDFGAIDDNPLIPNQEYVLAKIVYAVPGMSKSTPPSPKIDIRWRLMDGPYEGRQIFDSFSFHPNAVGISKRRLKQLGMPEAYKGTLQQLCEGVLIDTEAYVDVTTQKGGAGPNGQVYDDKNVVRKIHGLATELEAGKEVEF